LNAEFTTIVQFHILSSFKRKKVHLNTDLILDNFKIWNSSMMIFINEKWNITTNTFRFVKEIICLKRNHLKLILNYLWKCIFKRITSIKFWNQIINLVWKCPTEFTNQIAKNFSVCATSLITHQKGKLSKMPSTIFRWTR